MFAPWLSSLWASIRGDVSLSLVFLVVGPSRQLLPGPSFIPFCGDTFVSGHPSAAVILSSGNSRNPCTVPPAMPGWVGALGGCLRRVSLDIAWTLPCAERFQLPVHGVRKSRGSKRGKYSPSVFFRSSPRFSWISLDFYPSLSLPLLQGHTSILIFFLSPVMPLLSFPITGGIFF